MKAFPPFLVALLSFTAMSDASIPIVCGTGDDAELHAHAGRELAAYVEKLVGEKPAVVDDDVAHPSGAGDVVFLLGRGKANQRTRALETDGPVTFTIEDILPEHEDGFVIRSQLPRTHEGPVPVPAGPVTVVIAGRRPIGALYGVYPDELHTVSMRYIADGNRVVIEDDEVGRVEGETTYPFERGALVLQSFYPMTGEPAKIQIRDIRLNGRPVELYTGDPRAVNEGPLAVAVPAEAE